jgi:hypothetical protein
VSEYGDSEDTIAAKMAQSRKEIRRLLEPPSQQTGSPKGAASGVTGNFPRSRTMKLLLSGRGIGAVSAVLGGILMARPAIAIRLMRMIPVGAVARMLLVKGIASLRSRRG